MTEENAARSPYAPDPYGGKEEETTVIASDEPEAEHTKVMPPMQVPFGMTPQMQKFGFASTMGTVEGNSPAVNNIGSKPTLPNHSAPQAVAVPDAQTALADSKRLEKLAEGYMDNRQYREAFEIASQATLLDPKNVTAWVTRAESALLLKKYDEADFAADRACQHAPQSAEVFELSGRVNYYKREYEESLEAYREAVRLNPNRPFYATRVNLVIRVLGDSVSATSKARNLYNKFPEDRSARESYAQHLIWDIKDTLREVGDEEFFNNAKDVHFAEETLITIENIEVSNQKLLQEIREVKDLVEESNGYSIVNPGTTLVAKFVGAGIVMLLLSNWFFAHRIPGLIWSLVFLGGIGYLLYLSIMPSWKIRKMRILSTRR